MKKVALFGPYPPPYGGRSVHIKRLKSKLEKENVDVHLYTYTGTENEKNGIRKSKSILFHIFKEKYDIVHFHDRNFKLISILLFLSTFFNYKTVLTYHSFRDNPEEYGFLDKRLFKYIIKRIDKFLCVGSNEMEKLKKYVPLDKMEEIPAFIHPESNEDDKKSIPSEVWDFVNKQTFLITANGNVKFYKNEDLYGIDMLIDLIEALRKDGYHIGLLFALLGVKSQTEEERNYYTNIKQRIIDAGLQEHIYIYEVNESELYPILNESQLFIRPTNTDGFSLSIAEALILGVPTIASDVCKRPTGTNLFETRNTKELIDVTKKIINQYNEHVNYVEKLNIPDYFTNLLTLYKEMVTDNSKEAACEEDKK